MDDRSGCSRFEPITDIISTLVSRAGRGFPSLRVAWLQWHIEAEAEAEAGWMGPFTKLPGRDCDNVEPMKPPKGITDEPKWIRHCCQIYARAKELREGKISLIEASVALGPLASWTRTESERDFEVFRRLRDELIGLPIGRERKWWAARALAREDEKIRT